MPELPDVTHERLLVQGLSAQDTDALVAAGVGRKVEVDGVFGQTGGVATYFDAFSEG